MRVEDGRVEPETFSWVKFSGLSWRHDNTRFFNRRYPAPNMLFCILMRVVTQSTGFTIVTCRHFVMGLEIRELKSGSLVHQLPIDTGSVHGISARREDSSVFIGFTSFVTAGVIYQCNLDNEIPDMKVFHEITVPVFDGADFHVDQLITASKCCFVCGIFNSPGEFPSKDGTETPMFVVAGKNILLDGSHPCFLYGYSGFNISLTPSFSVSHIVLARHLGAVLLLFCIANMGVESMGRNGIKQGPSHKSKIALMTLFPPLDIFRLYPTQEVVCQRWKQCWASYWSLHKPEA